jgi:hypothetical protein
MNTWDKYLLELVQADIRSDRHQYLHRPALERLCYPELA